MAGFSTATTEHLTRTDVWSRQLKDVLLDDLFARRYVDWIRDFPDGQTLHIPSIGLLEARDYAEGQPIQYTAMDTGDWEFTINEYKSVATFIYDKFKHDSFYMNELTSRFVPNMHRALDKAMEIDFLEAGPLGQTASDPNTWNGAPHRWVGNGANETIAVKDFALADHTLSRANVPLVNKIALVDASVEYALGTLTNLVDLSFNPKWEGIVRDGISTVLRFKMSVFGWDIYICNNLMKNTAAETIDGKTAAAGVNNLFFSAAPDLLPIKGLIRQEPRIEFERNKDLQRDEYVATCYYGFKLFRPENLVVILTDTDQVDY